MTNPEMSSEAFTELKALAGCDVCQHTEWVTQEWAEEHFGSPAEAKFVVAASPAAVLNLIQAYERIKSENAILRGKVKHTLSLEQSQFIQATHGTERQKIGYALTSHETNIAEECAAAGYVNIQNGVVTLTERGLSHIVTINNGKPYTTEKQGS